MKRVVDFVASVLGLILLSPILLVISFLIFLTDRGNPFYTASRVGKSLKHLK